MKIKFETKLDEIIFMRLIEEIKLQKTKSISFDLNDFIVFWNIAGEYMLK